MGYKVLLGPKLIYYPRIRKKVIRCQNMLLQMYIAGRLDEGATKEDIYADFGTAFGVEGSSPIIRAVNGVVNRYYAQFPLNKKG